MTVYSGWRLFLSVQHPHGSFVDVGNLKINPAPFGSLQILIPLFRQHRDATALGKTGILVFTFSRRVKFLRRRENILTVFFNAKSMFLLTYEGGHGTGNLVLTFSRQGKHREFCCNTGKIFETRGKYF